MITTPDGLWALRYSGIIPHRYRFSPSSKAPLSTQVPRQNMLSATRASSSGAMRSRPGVMARGSRPAVGQHGSIALVERFILTLKNECTRIILVPLRREAFHRELRFFEVWFNQHRPHSALDGKTPYEMYHEISPACERPRYEPRARWPRSASCASPHAPVASHCGTPIRLDVRYHRGRKHLPIVELRRAE